MRRSNRPVQTKRASQGWKTTKATSNNNNYEDHNYAAHLSQKLNSAMPGMTVMMLQQCRGCLGRESRLKQGQWWQRQQQRLWRQQTITEMAGAGNNQQNAAAAVAETADMATAIVTAWRQRWWWLWRMTGGGSSRSDGGGIGCGVGWGIGGGFLGNGGSGGECHGD
jgi:hypothetical protein